MDETLKKIKSDTPWSEVHEMADKELKKGRIYVENPGEAPKGAQLKRGPKGGMYYEEGGTSEEKKPPPRVETKENRTPEQNDKKYYIPPSFIQAINQIESLDKKEEELVNIARGMAQSMAPNQPTEVHQRTLDKINEIREKKAKIWNNELRNKIVPNTSETLWQLAIKDKGMPVATHGEERYLDFSARDIKRILSQ